VAGHDEPDITLIANEIRRYLQSHPQAADSIEGVARWWLMRQRLEESRDRVERALESLVAEGVVEKVLSDTRVVYALAKDLRPQHRLPARTDDGEGG
jgi:hypothetical protein